MCLEGASVAGHGLITALAGRGLHTFYVWTPVLAADGREAAERAAAERDHPAARHYWDAEGEFAPALAGRLRLTPAETPTPRSPLAVAWDVYLAYPAGDVSLFAPSSWTHQLPTQRAPRLDAAAFRRTVETLLPRKH